MFKLNQFPLIFLGSNLNKETCDIELSEIPLHIIIDGWGKQYLLHSFGFEMEPFKKEMKRGDYPELWRRLVPDSGGQFCPIFGH